MKRIVAGEKGKAAIKFMNRRATMAPSRLRSRLRLGETTAAVIEEMHCNVLKPS